MEKMQKFAKLGTTNQNAKKNQNFPKIPPNVEKTKKKVRKNRIENKTVQAKHW